MKNNHKNIFGFDDLQNYLNDLYCNVNKERPWDYHYGYLIRSCGFMSVNSSKNNALQEHYIRAISWLYAISNMYNISIIESYIKRFPGVCYYCLSAPCICHKTNKLPLLDIPAYQVKEEREGYYRMITNNSLKNKSSKKFEWIKDNIFKIYPNNEIIWYHSGPWFHFTKLFEEVAELHQALSKYEINEENVDNVTVEIADVFAWILAIYILDFPNKNLVSEFINYYYDGCPICHNNPCICGPRKERRSGVVSIENLTIISEKVNELALLLDNRKSELSEIQKSIEKAIDNKSEQEVVQAVIQTKNKMESIKSTISDIDETGKKANSIIETIIKGTGNLINLIGMIGNIMSK